MRGGRRRATESIAPNRRPPPPTPTNSADPWQFLSTPVPGRESDASFCSSRPSIASAGRASTAIPNISDRSYQASALKTTNSYLASHSVKFHLKHPLPSSKDITETLKFLLHRLGFASQKMEEDLSQALKFLKCPLKLNKSALRPPDYLLYISGDDEAVEGLDEECIREMTEWKDTLEDRVKGLEDNMKELEVKFDGLKTGPSEKERLEQEKAMLEKDVTKFHIMIEQLLGHLTEVQKKLEEKDKALEAKVEDRKRICEENEDLKRTIEEQGINLRDAERMKRELQAVERDIEETETARNGWEEKIWELDSEIGHKFKELERLAMDCNQAIRRLKVGNGFQYQLNASASTPSKVLASDYKSVLKPALASFNEDIKRSSMGKLEELISLRQQSGENSAKLEERRSRIAFLQSHIDELATYDRNVAVELVTREVEGQLNVIRKEKLEYASRCASVARKLADDVDMEAQKMSVVEKEAAEFLKTSKAEFLKTSKAELQETIIRSEEEVKLCAQELFELINSVSTYKEYVGSKIARMRNDLLETAGTVVDTYKEYRPSQGKLTL
ncbi:hypothetical protein CASFOL_035795 [Castilleja foliolosa]|uniref:Kinetochore protein NDC80 n=1 Tax=Castilleja foliolosa TaxID=1961234 RepID=A0ABD3BUI5_9LAMI